MDSLYLLLPMSVLLVLALIGLFAWAVNAGQFDDLEREGWRIVGNVEGPAPQLPSVDPAPQSPTAGESHPV